MTSQEPIETFQQAEVKFPNEVTGRLADYVEIYPSGIVMVEDSGIGGGRTWYPPAQAPMVVG